MYKFAKLISHILIEYKWIVLIVFFVIVYTFVGTYPLEWFKSILGDFKDLVK